MFQISLRNGHSVRKLNASADRDLPGHRGKPKLQAFDTLSTDDIKDLRVSSCRNTGIIRRRKGLATRYLATLVPDNYVWARRHMLKGERTVLLGASEYPPPASTGLLIGGLQIKAGVLKRPALRREQDSGNPVVLEENKVHAD